MNHLDGGQRLHDRHIGRALINCTQWYAPGLADERRVNVGYPYPPLTLLFGWLGHLVKGDYRYCVHRLRQVSRRRFAPARRA